MASFSDLTEFFFLENNNNNHARISIQDPIAVPLSFALHNTRSTHNVEKRRIHRLSERT